MPVIYLLRHGQAAFGADDYDQLSDLGRRQAERAGEHLRQRIGRAERLVAGAMRRRQDSARAAADKLRGSPAVAEDRAWDEYDHMALIHAHVPELADPGALREHLAAQPDPQVAFQALFSAAAERWINGSGDYRESWDDFRGRVVGGLRRLGGDLASGESAVVVTSGGPIAAICHELLGVPKQQVLRLSWTLVNAGLTKLLLSGSGEVTVSSLNEHGFLEAESITYR